VICEGLRRDVESRGIPRERITVIPNAVDADQFAFNAAPDVELRKELGLEGKLVLGFLGSFYAYEGLDVLLEALPQLLREHPHARLLLAGGGPEEAALKARAARLGIADAVVFTGRVPHAQVSRYYSLVDLLVYPRHPMRLTDLVTPLKPLEAMALGRIVVASDVGGHRELIADGQTGFLFRAGDPAALALRLREVLALRDGWEAMRLRARRFVEEQRSWKRSVAGYEALYDRVCGRTPPGAPVPAFESHAEAVPR
jgi:PEP-CTERM/exosortase A-associated glycosyltransferase